MIIDASGGALLGDFVALLRLDLTAKLFLIVVLAGAVGLERQLAGKPAGLRTQILIGIGATLITDLSTRIGGPRSIPSHMIQNIITGVGFLGAGTILRGEGGLVQGLTSAATIWVVAMIGIAVGADATLEAVGTTIVVLAVLQGLGRFEHRLARVRRFVSLTVRAAKGTAWEPIEATLSDFGVKVVDRHDWPHATDVVFELRVMGAAGALPGAREALAELTGVRAVTLE
jgi:putative Mg2+ transporter-C (MgtC) family protein